MDIKRNQPLSKDVLDVNYLMIKNISDSAHSNIFSALSDANLIYNDISVTEDIIQEDFLSLYTQAKDIDFSLKQNNKVFESFLTTTYSDSEFSTKNRLKIDTQNGNIILPIIDTEDLYVKSIVLESDSNGSVGNSFDGNSNNDISVILDSTSQSLFEYEKIRAYVDDTNLTLSLMFELEDETVANAVYIKLFAIDNGKFPVLDMIDISLDSVNWSSAKNFILLDSINKGDYFIRFLPQKIKYVRMRFSQSAYDSLRTVFGYRYRSVIGIREVTFKKIKYNVSGEYISVPYSTGKTISSVNFKYKDVSNNDIKYFISGNNGGRWIGVGKDGETISIINENAGIMDGNEAKTVRVKMQMDKSGSVLSKVDTTEYMQLSPGNKYYLKQVPESVEVYAGRHVSVGEDIRYSCDKSDVPIKQFLIKFIPYSKALMMYSETERLMNVYVDGVKAPDDMWTAVESSNPNNATIVFSEAFEGVLGNSAIAVDFKEIRHIPTQWNSFTNIIKLPFEIFYPVESDIIVKELKENETQKTLLSAGDYVIVDNSTVKINDTAFNKTSQYFVAFTPAFKITNSVHINNNEVEIYGMSTNRSMTLRFDYSYKSAYDSELIDYYTPIGLEYSMEIQ